MKQVQPIAISTRRAREAAEHLRRIHGETPVTHIETLEKDGIILNLYGKFENVNAMNTFKSRGAEWFVYNLMYQHHNREGQFRRKQIKPVLVTPSAGNHAQGVALAANRYGLEAEIFMPENASPVKIRRVKSLGANVHLVGRNFDETFAAAHKFRRLDDARVFVPPYENPFIMEGQASVGVEILSKLCTVSSNYHKTCGLESTWNYPDVVLCGLGGGGLASGLGSVFREVDSSFLTDRKIHLIGVQTEAADSMYQSIKSRKLMPSSYRNMSSIADGIAVRQASPRMLATIQKYVDQVVVVSEENITKAMAYMYQHPFFNIKHPIELLKRRTWKTLEKDAGIPFRKLPDNKPIYAERPLYVLEGAAAAPYAATLFGDMHDEIDWKKIAGRRKILDVYVILSGGNIPEEKTLEISRGIKRRLNYHPPCDARRLRLLGVF